LRDDGTCARLRGEHIEQRLQPAFGDERIVVEKMQEGTARCRGACVACCAEAAVALQTNGVDAGAGREQFVRPIGRGVVDDDDFDGSRRIDVRRKRAQARVGVGPAVVRRNDDGDERRLVENECDGGGFAGKAPPACQSALSAGGIASRACSRGQPTRCAPNEDERPVIGEDLPGFVKYSPPSAA
jgi:hypothetical protein